MYVELGEGCFRKNGKKVRRLNGRRGYGGTTRQLTKAITRGSTSAMISSNSESSRLCPVASPRDCTAHNAATCGITYGEGRGELHTSCTTHYSRCPSSRWGLAVAAGRYRSVKLRRLTRELTVRLGSSTQVHNPE